MFVSSHASKKALENELNKSKKKDIYGVLIPDDLKVGFKLYNKNKNFVGEIASEDKRNWYIKRPKDNEPIEYMTLRKENTEQKFIDEYFVVMEDIDETNREDIIDN